jgi:hypothetical protein
VPQRDRLGTVRGLSGDFHIILCIEDGCKPLPNDWMVIDNENADHA